ncbi:ankyrin repeat protein [Colletotrichum sojae]|uniref:Ankyrin repeat protein n=1 Tax=Colletotrichum sojae TaxID=2175907 RepID=A0A8H6IR91_9PEZI|nr:ankyrin repeat protein [Colletotrichum sojae]
MADPLSIAASVAGIVQLSVDVFQRVCKQTLSEIEKRLEKAQDDFDGQSRTRTRAVLRSLRWPFSADETKSLVSNSAGHRSTLELALSAETLGKLLQSLASQDEINGGLNSLMQKFDRLSAIQTRAEMSEKRRETVETFLKVNPQANFHTSRRLRQPMTGLWLTESNLTFQKWRDIPHSAIWLSGIPGAGKTLLSGAVIEEILQLSNDSTAVAFFYCDYKNDESKKLTNLMSALAVQLAQQNDAAFELLEAHHHALTARTGLKADPDAEGLHRLISQMSALYKKVYIIIDGLDEYENNVPEVTAGLTELRDNCSSVSMAVFSRDEQEIREELEEDFAHVEIAAHTEDLDLYVRAEMSTRKQPKKLAQTNPRLREEIREKLVGGAQGMFRWVACQLDYLCELTNNRAHREALSSLPPTLEETYHRLLQRVLAAGPDVTNLVRKTLHWTAVDRHIQLPVLQEGVSIPDSPNAHFSEDDLIETDEIYRRCSSLVRKVPMRNPDKRELLEFAHFTVVEYLRSIDPGSDVAVFKLEDERAMDELCKTCLRSLLMADLGPDYSALKPVRLYEHVITLFAPRKSPQFLCLAYGVLKGETIHPWAMFEDETDPKDIMNSVKFVDAIVSPNFTTLKLAASFDLPEGVRWLDAGLNVFYVAAAGGNCSVLFTLLAHIKKNCSTYQKLYRSEPWCSNQCTKALISNTLNVKGLEPIGFKHYFDTWPFPATFSGTPMHYAVVAKGPGIIDALLDHGADINARDHQTAIMYAALYGNIEMTLALDTGDSVLRIQTQAGKTVLHLWVSQPRFLNGALRLLHKYGMIERFIDRENRVYFSPLCTAAIGNYPASIDPLLKYRANIDKEGCPHGSPLMAAKAASWMDISDKEGQRQQGRGRTSTTRTRTDIGKDEDRNRQQGTTTSGNTDGQKQ